MIKNLETIVLGGGCFWCTEAIFKELKGVKSVTSGYAGGENLNPTYEQVSRGDTDFAEVIEVTFDPRVISLAIILDIFWHVHDPTTLNRQGPDIGRQYRSVIFTTSQEQMTEAQGLKKKLDEAGEYSQPLVTEIEMLRKFFPAEDYHQNYYWNNQENRYCSLVITPKLRLLRARYKDALG